MKLSLNKLKYLIVLLVLISIPSVSFLQKIAFNFYDKCPETIIQNINLVKAEFFNELDQLVKTKDLPSNQVDAINDLINTSSTRLLDLSNIQTLQRAANQDDEFAKQILAETQTQNSKNPNSTSEGLQLANRINQCQAAVQAAISEMQQITSIHQKTASNTVQAAIMVDYLDQFNEKLGELVQSANLIHANTKSLNNNFPCFQSDCVSG